MVDVLNMVVKDVEVAPGDLVNLTGDNVNVGNIEDANSDNLSLPFVTAIPFYTVRRNAEYGKFLKELVHNKYKLEQISSAFLSDKSSAMIQNKVPPKLRDPVSFLIPFDSAMKHSYSNDDTCFSIDVIDEILEEDFDALLDEGSKILYSIEGTPLEDKIFTNFDEFIAMNIKENFESESDEEITLKKSALILIIKSRNLLMNLLRILNSNRFLIT
ncbi:hypothetical protein Tco_0512156 [Tanacetum coccineum]